MKYYFEILISLIMVLALFSFFLKSGLIAVIGIAAFFVGCIIENILRNKT